MKMIESYKNMKQEIFFCLYLLSASTSHTFHFLAQLSSFPPLPWIPFFIPRFIVLFSSFEFLSSFSYFEVWEYLYCQRKLVCSENQSIIQCFCGVYLDFQSCPFTVSVKRQDWTLRVTVGKIQIGFTSNQSWLRTSPHSWTCAPK